MPKILAKFFAKNGKSSHKKNHIVTEGLRKKNFFRKDVNVYQNYNSYYPQNQVRPIPQTTSSIAPSYGFKGRPVSSLEEARAIPIDFDGTVFFFPDLANRRIYTKQINLDGTANLSVYELKETPTFPQGSHNYITREEFENALLKIQSSIGAMAIAPTIKQPDQNKSNQEQEAPQYLF